MPHELAHVWLEVREGGDLQHRRGKHLRGTRGAHGFLARTATAQFNNRTVWDHSILES